jgi:hypothetical protein
MEKRKRKQKKEKPQKTTIHDDGMNSLSQQYTPTLSTITEH